MTDMTGKRGIVLLNDDLNLHWIKWMKEAGLNVLALHDLSTRDFDCIEKTIQNIQSDNGKKLISMAIEEGIDIEYEMHALSWLLPRSEFVKHPEWFREDEHGNRVPQNNMCISNRDALDVISENAIKLAQLLPPTTNNYYMWADDAENASCHCEQCRKFTGSEQNLIMMNAILKGLKKVNSNAKLPFLAYADVLEVPKRIEPEEGIFLEFAPIKRRFDKCINDIDTQENFKYKTVFEEMLSFFDPKHAHVLEYWLDASMFSNWQKPAVKIPFYNEVFLRDVDYYSSNGIDFITSFGAFIDEEYYNAHGIPPVMEYGKGLAGI